MNYYFDMLKNYVYKELDSDTPELLDDGEFCFACGLLLSRSFSSSQLEVYKEAAITCQTLTELKQQIVTLFPYKPASNKEITSLYTMITSYSPCQSEFDSVLVKSFLYAITDCSEPKKNKQKDYSSNLICKTYKLNKELVDDFALACKMTNQKLGPKLTELMISFIEETISS